MERKITPTPITTSTKFDKPSLEFPHPIVREGGEGIQKIWRYPNGYGASAVKFKINPRLPLPYPIGNHGIEKNLWEMAILKFENKIREDTFFTVCYTSGITNEVIGYLNPKEIEEYLIKVKNLKNRGKK